MTRPVRTRIVAETVLGAVAGSMGLLTLVWRDWLEAVFGWDPDHHSGSAELVVVLAPLMVALLMGWTARWERRRAFGPGALTGPELSS